MRKNLDENIKRQLEKKMTHFIKYFPVRIRNVGEDAILNRQLMWDFKDGKGEATEQVAQMTAFGTQQKLAAAWLRANRPSEENGENGTAAYQEAQALKKQAHLSNVRQIVLKYMDADGNVTLPSTGTTSAPAIPDTGSDSGSGSQTPSGSQPGGGSGSQGGSGGSTGGSSDGDGGFE